MSKTELIEANFTWHRTGNGYRLDVEATHPIIGKCELYSESMPLRFNKKANGDGGWVALSSEVEGRRDPYPRIWLPKETFERITDFASLHSESQCYRMKAKMWYCASGTLNEGLMDANNLVFY